MEKQTQQKNAVSDKAVIILMKKFEEAKQKNSRWSLRAYAAKLGLSSGALSEILQGKRLLSAQLKKKISDKLQLSPLESADFFEDYLPSHLKEQRLEYYRLSNDQFHLISDWYHYALLNLIQTKGFRPTVPWMAQRLGLEEKIVAEAWERLFRLNLIQQQGARVVRTHLRLETSDDLLNLSIQKSHLNDQELIEKSLQEIPPDLRDNTSMTLVIKKKNISKAKELIRLFYDRFSSEVEVEDGEEVYKLSISFFPLTNVLEKK